MADKFKPGDRVRIKDDGGILKSGGVRVEEVEIIKRNIIYSIGEIYDVKYNDGLIHPFNVFWLELVEKREATPVGPKKCNCNITVLLSVGCKCGGI
jgi:hypothetical protein